MKTEYNREPEFSISYKHVGVQVTFSVKVLAQDYLASAATDSENEENFGILFDKSLPVVAPQVASQLMKLHSLFEEALGQAYCNLIVSRARESLMQNQANQHSTTDENQPC